MIEKLEAAARELAEQIGKKNLKRDVVCARAEVPEGSFGYATGMKFDEWVESLDLPDTDHPIIGLRLDPALRKDQIILKALELSHQRGYVNIHFDDIAKELDISAQGIKHYYPSIDILRDTLMEKAIALDNYSLITQGVVNCHPMALALDMETKTKAVHATLIG